MRPICYTGAGYLLCPKEIRMLEPVLILGDADADILTILELGIEVNCFGPLYGWLFLIHANRYTSC